jgi:4-hydroxy-3-methylbut-2-enyl diphosphate reductase
VWNRSEQIAKKNYTVVVHGKPRHEETRATFSHAAFNTPTVVVNDMNEAIALSKFITGEVPSNQFYETFRNQYSNGFDAEKDLQRIGVVNQTTMLAGDTQAIADFLKLTMVQKYNLTEADIENHFADTRDTLCYATNDNQSAAVGLLETKADFAIVIGGYNSSNTSHLVELCEEKLPTYFINSDEKILSEKEMLHYDFHAKKEILTAGYLANNIPQKILITSGASCPDALVEDVIRKLTGFFTARKSIEEMIKEMS